MRTLSPRQTARYKLSRTHLMSSTVMVVIFPRPSGSVVSELRDSSTLLGSAYCDNEIRDRRIEYELWSAGEHTPHHPALHSVSAEAAELRQAAHQYRFAQSKGPQKADAGRFSCDFIHNDAFVPRLDLFSACPTAAGSGSCCSRGARRASDCAMARWGSGVELTSHQLQFSPSGTSTS